MISVYITTDPRSADVTNVLCWGVSEYFEFESFDVGIV